MKIKIFDSRITGAYLPAFGAGLTASVDVYACINTPMIFAAGGSVTIPLGFAIFLEAPGYAGIVTPVSTLAASGVLSTNGIGLIDGLNKSQLSIQLWNRSLLPYTISPMDKIGQLTLLQVLKTPFEVVADFPA